MAIDFLSNINLNNNKIEDFVVDHSNTTDATDVTGKLIYDSGTLKYYDGSTWQSLGTSSGTMSSWILEDGDGTEVTVSDSKEVKFVEGGGLDIDWTDVTDGTDGDPYDLTFTLDISGYSTVTPVSGASGDSLLTLDSDGSTHQLTTLNALASAYAGNGLVNNSGQIDVNIDDVTIEIDTTLKAKTAAIANGGTGLATADQIHTFVTTQTDTIAADTSGTAATVTVTDSTANTNFPVVFHNESNGLLDDTGALTYNPSTGSLSVANLTVTGTQTVNNVNVIETSSGVIFEGSTADDYETTLDVVDPTADRAINLPNDSGTVLLVENVVAGSNVSISANGAGDTITIASTNTTYTAGDGLDLTGTEFSADLKANGGLVIESTELAVDLSASSITGTLAISDGGTGATTASAAFAALKQAATTSQTGVVELATTGEAKNGSGSGKVVDASQIGARSVVATIDVSDSNFISNKYAEITHSLATEDIIVELFDATNKNTVYATVARTDKAGSASTSKCLISFDSVPGNDVEVIITSAAGASSGTIAYA